MLTNIALDKNQTDVSTDYTAISGAIFTEAADGAYMLKDTRQLKTIASLERGGYYQSGLHCD